jgi:hypothetical protein
MSSNKRMTLSKDAAPGVAEQDDAATAEQTSAGVEPTHETKEDQRG